MFAGARGWMDVCSVDRSVGGAQGLLQLIYCTLFRELSSQVNCLYIIGVVCSVGSRRWRNGIDSNAAECEMLFDEATFATVYIFGLSFTKTICLSVDYNDVPLM